MEHKEGQAKLVDEEQMESVEVMQLQLAMSTYVFGEMPIIYVLMEPMHLLLYLVDQELKKFSLLLVVVEMAAMVDEEEMEVMEVKEDEEEMVVKVWMATALLIVQVAMEGQEETEAMVEMVGPEVMVGREEMEGMLVMEEDV